ncbi:J domain-containing protein [Oryzomonas rubra]|uniref:J domain-containing protein n=1 Tax=Oryzomonas rubra TaxID=2509454 RepID=A0A5A9X7D7_9BACT|nr:J domain-containing protein [Oryzomonas rubra]KAA0888704.1 J domain-containing protein [Oryzomonas rubra]
MAINKKKAEKILGVKEAEGRESIRKAYRCLAKKHHPDAGGKKEDFELLQIAMDTLLDEDKEPGQPVQDFMKAFQQAVTGCNPTRDDLIKRTRDVLCKKINGLQQQIEANRKAIANSELIISRLTCKRPNDPVKVMLENAAASSKQVIKQLEGMIESMQGALEIADAYEYRTDPPQDTTTLSIAAFMDQFDGYFNTTA